MARNIAKFIGFRLYPEQVALLARIAKRMKISESEVVRRALEDFNEFEHI